MVRPTAKGEIVNNAALTRWYRLREHAEQRALWESPARFRVAACGRRSGKSELAKRQGVKRAIAQSPYPDFRVLFGGPTYQQAKRVFWSDVKKLVPRWALLGQDPRKAISEGELTIKLRSGAEIIVTGLDAPMRVEGSPLDFVVVDESADVKESAWLEHIRPGLSERGGEAWLIGTPDGRNWFWQAAQKAHEDDSGLWSFHTWPSSTVLAPAEIELARAELDERTFAQEFEASFLDPTGQVYYPFRRELHAVERLEYDPSLPLVLCFDFNVAPGICVVAQERQYRGSNPGVDVTKPVTCVIDEVWIPTDSNTGRVCAEIIARYGNHLGDVLCYGDASGGARHTSQVHGSDWTIIEKSFRPIFGQPRTRPGRGDFETRIKNCNPRERVRVNAVNSRLQSADGAIHLLVDPRCVHAIQDFEGVVYRQGTSEIDKKGSPTLTHLTDALGYHLDYEYPVYDNRFIIEQIC